MRNVFVRGWTKQKVKIIACFQSICFSIDDGLSDPLFTHLLTLSTTFVLILVKRGFDTPIFWYKSEMISIIYHKYGEIISLLPWNNFFIYIQEFSLSNCSYLFDSIMKNCVFIYEKDLLFSRNSIFCLIKKE